MDALSFHRIVLALAVFTVSSSPLLAQGRGRSGGQGGAQYGAGGQANSQQVQQQITAIGQRVDAENQQLKYGLGYDHNFVLNQKMEGLNYAAKVIEPVSGRTMEVYTDEPGLQFYGGNFLNGIAIGKNIACRPEARYGCTPGSP